ncbi:hypothetical protein IFM89_012355 [Coptis chinensis]|uniref:Pentatricopeptide repeat-containing protein n=1 Tax=Coptis chinensis TaxID=261450 RepID=A0A835I0E4_9MAGN|nr:hypothetical protein IFM89_012355 [Coptis chinensis]
MIVYSNPLKQFIPYLQFFKRYLFTKPISPKDSSNIITCYSKLLQNSISSKSLDLGNLIHAQLIKTGLTDHTFLGNRLLEVYSKFGVLNESLQVFYEMPNKNLFTWNVLLVGLFKSGDFDGASVLFDEMPERDVVSWNSMISGCVSNGFVGYALVVFAEMQNVGVKPSAYTYSIVMSCLSCGRQGKQVHGSVLRSGLNLSNVVICNSLIDMYSKLKLIDYAFGVFLTMEELDVISWNSLILGCGKSDYGELALDQFCSMRLSGYSPDQHTISAVITVCSNLRALEKGKQIFALCFKMGFLCNSIVASATIDMFSKCNRLDDSVRLFEEIRVLDVALCNSMISSYVRHGYEEDAFQLFVLTLRGNIQPTEFTLSIILTSVTCLVRAEQGIQIHSLARKLGLESEGIVASSLMDMYAKSGLIDSAMVLFAEMTIRDLVSWNTLIMGFARNGLEWEALETFMELLEQGVLPDRITLAGVLLACSQRGLLSEGSIIFSSMEEKYGVTPGVEHYACLVDMMCRMDKLTEAMEIVERMHEEPNVGIWTSLLIACVTNQNLELTERIAERVMELEPHSSLPYLVLAQAYEMKCRWESIARIRKAMQDRGIRKVTDHSWIGIKNRVFAFKGNPVLYCGSEGLYSILSLLVWEMVDKGYISQSYADTEGHVVWDRGKGEDHMLTASTLEGHMAGDEEEQPAKVQYNVNRLQWRETVYKENLYLHFFT